MNRYRLVYYRVDDPCEPGGLPKSQTIEIDAPSAADAVYIAPTRLRERPMDLHIVDIVPLIQQIPCVQCGILTGDNGVPFVTCEDGHFCHACYRARAQAHRRCSNCGTRKDKHGTAGQIRDIWDHSFTSEPV